MGTLLRSASCFFVLVFLCFCFSGAQTSRAPKNVQVALRAKWSGTPVLLEAGELISKEWKDFFWDFVDSWIHSENVREPSSAKDCLDKILAHGRTLLSEPLASLFEFSLTLRAASPRLVLYRQLAEESLSSFPLDDEIITSTNGPKSRCCWVDTSVSLLFDVSELQAWLHSLDSETVGAVHQLQVFEFDHVHPDSAPASQIAVLYGALGTKCFQEFHLALSEAATLGKVKYVVRSVLPVGCESESSVCGAVGTGGPLNLGGYGVELALKNMEYKAMDDSLLKKGVTLEDPHSEDLSEDVEGSVFSQLSDPRPDDDSEILNFRDHLLSSTVSDTLDVWELKDLGLQTVQRILRASDPLLAMQEINQNFPSVVSLISRTKLNESIKDEIISNQRMIPPGKSLMALNGALIDIEDADIYLMVSLAHQELLLAEQYKKLKIPPGTVKKLLSVLAPSESFTPRVDFRSPHVHYINNLEVDPMYKRWRSNLNELLMPVFPGQLRYIRKNLFHAVYILDPASPCGLETVDMIISSFENNFPIRFGAIFYSEKAVEKIEVNDGELPVLDLKNDHEDISDLMIRLFNYIKENHGVLMAFQFLSNVNKLRIESDSDIPEMHHVEGAFVDTILPRAKSPPQETLLRVEKEPRFAEVSMESTMFVVKLGFSNLGCSFLMNGLVHEPNEEALINAMNEELPRIQEQVYYGQINSQTDVLDKFLSESGVQRYNPKIVAEGKAQRKFTSLCASVLTQESIINDVHYLHSPETTDDLKPVTHLLVVDVDSKKGIKLLREGIRYLISGSKNSRIGVMFNSNDGASIQSLFFIEAFRVTASTYSNKKGVLQFLEELCSLFDQGLSAYYAAGNNEELVDKVIQLAEANGLPTKSYKSVLSAFSSESSRSNLNKDSRFLYRVLGIEHGVNAVVTNGRVFPLSDGGTFLSHDLHLLESLEFKQRIKHIAEIIETIKWDDVDPDALTSKFISDVVMAVSSSISARDRSSESARFEILSADFSAVILGNEDSSIHIDAVIDPLSPSGQKLSSLLWILSKYVQPSMRLVLNPVSSLEDLPLKNYYRYVVPSTEDFSTANYAVHGPRAVFTNMPLLKTLTMNLDVPEPWLVQPIVAIHDLDNILLENLAETRTLQAVFELEALVLTGHCSEKDHEPPRGLQLILGTKNNPHLVDTLVMANLGYWQMKVLPGVWYLQLAPGRSSNLYVMKVDGEGTRGTAFLKRITIEDLRGKVVHLEVVKKKGMELETLLVPSSDDDDHSSDKKGTPGSWNSNILKWASGFIGGAYQLNMGQSGTLEPESGARHGKNINIFSVASGHLYERFLKIMILSVLKNTNRPVKFWFIKNYLSPPFKDVIPHMADHYGFEYELVTYKWPSWLHKQKEKQRIIWAYKILFLDVIFPLDLEKVIFVDADQIVRADMGELYDMDLNGRPLAYTPFCDNNKDMDGYRFWKQGFWKDHLRGRPYHISALYVVDLVKFRETAAGDQLRVFYETLSKDPNSLSNLDQDLPNYAQHLVPIHSLPQEWLWCESWCGNTTKPKAKTIDLCNNPMTKEPKLQGAKRIVAEWPDLDMEARRFTAQILGETIEPQEQAQPLDHLGKPETPASSPENEESKAEL